MNDYLYQEKKFSRCLCYKYKLSLERNHIRIAALIKSNRSIVQRSQSLRLSNNEERASWVSEAQ